MQSLIVFQDGEIAIAALKTDIRLSVIEKCIKKHIEGFDLDEKIGVKNSFASSFINFVSEIIEVELQIEFIEIADPFSNADFTFKVKNNNRALSWICEDAFGNEITDFTDVSGIERIRYVKKGGAIQEYDIEKVTSEDKDYLSGVVVGKGFRRFLKDNIISRETI